MRAFIAVSLPEEVRTSLANLQRELARSGADVKWVEPENLHLTLKFLDEITDEQRREVETLLRRIGTQHHAFMLALHEAGAFPSVNAPRVVWVGCGEGAEVLARIAGQVEQESATWGFRKEERPFAAHLTIGRVRSPRRRQELAQSLQTTSWQPPAPWRVEMLTLYQSVLGSAGPRYTSLADIPLAAPST